MKKQTRLLMLIGALCMGFTVLTRSFFTIPESIGDFLKGFGVAFIFSAFILMVRQRQTCKTKVKTDTMN
jgi:hypothetical protein